MLVIVAALLSHPDTVRAQGTACRECGIALVDARPLGVAEGFPVDQARLSVAVTLDGRFVTTGIGPPGTVAVFDPDGRYQAAVGRVGGGPGEYLGPTRVIRGLAGQLLVIDPDQGRITVLSPTLQLVRTIPMTRRVDRIAESPIGLVGENFEEPGLFRIPDRGGWTAFGQPEGTRPAAREMTVSSVGQLWTARTDQYVLERWNPDGSVGVVVSRPVPWFPGPPGPVDLASKPAPPAMAGLLADSAANLWVLIAETRQPFEPRVVTRSDGWREIDLDLWLSRRDTRIEVIDSRRGTVLAEGKHRCLIWPTGTFPLVYSVRDPLNDPVVVVRRLVLAAGGDRR